MPYQTSKSAYIMNHTPIKTALYLNKEVVGRDTKQIMIAISCLNKNKLSKLIIYNFQDISFLA